MRAGSASAFESIEECSKTWNFGTEDKLQLKSKHTNEPSSPFPPCLLIFCHFGERPSRARGQVFDVAVEALKDGDQEIGLWNA